MNYDSYFPTLFQKNYKQLYESYNISKNNNIEKNINNLTNFNKIRSTYNKNKIEDYNNQSNSFKLLNKLINNINNNQNIINNNKVNNYNNKYSIERSNDICLNNSISKKNKSDIPNINKNINEEIININENNNTKKNYSDEIKIKKNKKMIYMNKCCIKEKKKYKINLDSKSNRKSIYRGVSKNGKKFQTILSYKYHKNYVGVYSSAETAARVYDIISLKNRGIKAQTNFEYNIHQIQNIIDTDIDYKSKNIEEIISTLLNL